MKAVHVQAQLRPTITYTDQRDSKVNTEYLFDNRMFCCEYPVYSLVARL